MHDVSSTLPLAALLNAQIVRWVVWVGLVVLTIALVYALEVKQGNAVGILNLIGESTPVAIHGVHHVFHPPVLLDAWPDADHRSRIVFITRGIERADLEASFFEHVAAAQV